MYSKAIKIKYNSNFNNDIQNGFRLIALVAISSDGLEDVAYENLFDNSGLTNSAK